MNPVTSWMLSLMVAFAPPDAKARASQLPGHAETSVEKSTRYESIAKDLFDVVYDPKETPLFRGAKGRARTAALVLAVAYHESGFAHDVDVGPCYRGRDGQGARCDHGRSACLMQLHVGDGKTIQGYTQEELFSDRKKCFRAGLGLLRKSFSECRLQDPRHRLNAYASGVCDHGEDGSERLMAMMDKFAGKLPIPNDDSAVEAAEKTSTPQTNAPQASVTRTGKDPSDHTAAPPVDPRSRGTKAGSGERKRHPSVR